MAGFKAFSQKGSPSQTPKRNVFDLSFQNNLTMKFGTLYPVFCKEVIPGDSFKIDPVFGLRLMPMVFPTMTRMKANLHFFYVRNRNLWSDWPDFIGKTRDNLVPPYVDSKYNLNMFGVGTLSDYLGFPSVTYFDRSYTSRTITVNRTIYSPAGFISRGNIFNSFVETESAFGISYLRIDSSSFGVDGVLVQGASSPFSLDPDYTPSAIVGLAAPDGSILDSRPAFNSSSDKLLDIGYSAPSYKQFVTDAGYEYGYLFCSFVSSTNLSNIYGLPVKFSASNTSDKVDSSILNSLHPSALPYRAYESIYNAFYRNEQNNPRIVNGMAIYNDYIPTHSGGLDLSYYHLYQANWENDMFTTAVPSPQQGIAPLVGISSTGVATFLNEDEQPVNVQLTTDDDGNTVTGYVSSSETKGSVARALINLASEGISINDFRNVNALQKWLETNIRKGYKYKDQIKSHFGVDVSFAELDMPEFIGGISRNIVMNDVTQTSASNINGSDTPLGSWAGNGSCFGGSDHSISHYCDEHGFIIGIMYVSPIPNYPQVLSKHWIKKDPFDYFFPEFGHIGMQAIPNKLVAPLQCKYTGSDADADLTFGYQRAWYEYLGSVDEVHGDFLTTLDNYVIQRHFTEVPKLSADFTTISDNSAYQVFADQSVNDKILGQIYFNVTAKRPIPLFGDPSLTL